MRQIDNAPGQRKALKICAHVRHQQIQQVLRAQLQHVHKFCARNIKVHGSAAAVFSVSTADTGAECNERPCRSPLVPARVRRLRGEDLRALVSDSWIVQLHAFRQPCSRQ